MRVTLYHNPKCSNSRAALDILRAKGSEPVIVEYLKTPLTKSQLKTLIAKMGVTARDIVRSKEPLYAELNLDTATGDKLLAAIAAHPILLNRPIVVSDKGAKLCRPPERVLELL